MGFFESYKHLDKICSEMFDNAQGVTSYINEMEKLYRGANTVQGWNEDLRRLKHYRHVRNQIAHDPMCTEQNMCSDEDICWLVRFYDRIMKQTDPLALYRNETHMHCSRPSDKAQHGLDRGDYTDDGDLDYSDNDTDCEVPGSNSYYDRVAVYGIAAIAAIVAALLIAIYCLYR